MASCCGLGEGKVRRFSEIREQWRGKLVTVVRGSGEGEEGEREGEGGDSLEMGAGKS